MEYLIPLLLLYFLPTWLAPRGRRGSVFFINLAVGWTIIGWFITMAIAVHARENAKAGA